MRERATTRLFINTRIELSKLFRKALAPRGVRELPPEFPQDFSDFSKRLWKAVHPYTLTSKERIFCIENAIRYLVGHGIEGDIVECGVAAGGSMMAAALTLLELGTTDRRLLLYDTFAGMTEPTDEDISIFAKSAKRQYRKRLKDGVSTWINFPLEQVQENFRKIDYPQDKVIFVKGPVEDTLPARCHGQIALLRLDTDWYQSTKVELEQLFPMLAVAGILILDDFNRWLGSRKAVDEYFRKHGIRMFLMRIDDHCVVGVKAAPR